MSLRRCPLPSWWITNFLFLRLAIIKTCYVLVCLWLNLKRQRVKSGQVRAIKRFEDYFWNIFAIGETMSVFIVTPPNNESAFSSPANKKTRWRFELFFENNLVAVGSLMNWTFHDESWNSLEIDQEVSRHLTSSQPNDHQTHMSIVVDEKRSRMLLALNFSLFSRTCFMRNHSHLVSQPHQHNSQTSFLDSPQVWSFILMNNSMTLCDPEREKVAIACRIYFYRHIMEKMLSARWKCVCECFSTIKSRHLAIN